MYEQDAPAVIAVAVDGSSFAGGGGGEVTQILNVPVPDPPNCHILIKYCVPAVNDRIIWDILPAPSSSSHSTSVKVPEQPLEFVYIDIPESVIVPAVSEIV